MLIKNIFKIALVFFLTAAAAGIQATIAPQIYFDNDPVISGGKTDFAPGDKISGSAQLWNYENGAVGDLFFKYQIWSNKVDDVPTGMVDQKTDAQSFSLAPKENTTKQFEYALPASLPDGPVVFRIQLVTGRGEELAWFDYDINVSRGVAFLDLSNNWILQDGKKMDAGGGIYYKIGDKVEVVFDAANNSGKSITGYYKVFNHIRNSSGQLVGEEKKETVTMNAGQKKTITAVLPAATAPETYLSEVKFFDPKTNQPISNAVFFRWIISGENAKVLYVVPDKEAYSAGEKAQVQVDYTGSADYSVSIGKGTIKTKITDSAGNEIGSASKDVELVSGKTIVEVPISKNVNNPKVVTTITKGDKKLDSYGYGIETKNKIAEEPPAAPQPAQKMDAGKFAAFMALFTVIIVSVAFYFMKKKNNKNIAKPLTAILIAGGMLFAPGAFAAWEAINGCGDTTINFVKPSPDKTYYAGGDSGNNEVRFTGKFQVTSCGNGLFNNKISFYITEDKPGDDPVDSDINYIPFIDCDGRSGDTCTSGVQCTCSACVNCYGSNSPWLAANLGIANCQSGTLYSEGSPYTSFLHGNEVKDIDTTKGHKVYKLGSIYPGDASHPDGERWRVEFNKKYDIPADLGFYGPVRFYVVYSGTHWAHHWHWNTTYQKGTIVPAPKLTSLQYTPPDYCSSGPGGIFSWSFTCADNSVKQKTYHIQIDDSPSFSGPLVIDETGGTSQSFAPMAGKLEYDKTYYWRIKIIDSYNFDTQWVEGPSFTTPNQAAPRPDFSYSPSYVFAGEKADFDSAASLCSSGAAQIACSDDPANSYAWDFDNSKTAAGETAQTIFVEKKTYNVKLSITSNSTVPHITCSKTKAIGITKEVPSWEEVSPLE